VIVAEPIRNLSTSGLPLLAALARRQTDAGRGPETHRFDEATLDALISTLTPPPSRSFVIPGGREKVFIFDVEEESHAGEAG
jgi:hypothetical protein